MSAADREMHKMRSAGAQWNEIIAVWEQLTGEEKSAGALSKRYTRMMDNFKTWPEAHVCSLHPPVSRRSTSAKNMYLG